MNIEFWPSPLIVACMVPVGSKLPTGPSDGKMLDLHTV